MNETVDPAVVYDTMGFSDQSREFLEAFGDTVNRAFFTYVAEREKVTLDKAYSFLSESEIVKERYDNDFDRGDVTDIRGEMPNYVSQRAADSGWNPERERLETYFELTPKGEALAEEMNIGGLLE